MNLKLAKRLRRLLRVVVEGGLPEETRYEINTRTGQVRASRNCARGIYRHWKRSIKNEG